MFAHDPLILLLPLALHFLQLGFAHHGIEAGPEMAHDPAHSSGPITDGAHDPRQVLGTDDDQRHQGNEQQLRGCDIEHVAVALTPSFSKTSVDESQGSRLSWGSSDVLRSAGE